MSPCPQTEGGRDGARSQLAALAPLGDGRLAVRGGGAGSLQLLEVLDRRLLPPLKHRIVQQPGGVQLLELLQPLPLGRLARAGVTANQVTLAAIVLSLAGLLVPIPLMALDLLTGAVQAYIFAVLATVFIGAAVSVEGAETPRKDTH